MSDLPTTIDTVEPVDRTDVAESAAAVAALLERIDAGEVEATDDERLRLEGALAALAEVVDPN